MARDPDADFAPVVGLVIGGMALPPLVVAVVADPSALPVDGRGLVVLAACLFGLVATVLIESRDLDRVNLLTAAIVVPWPVLLVGIHVVLLVNPGEPVPRGPLATIFRFLIGPVADLFVYGGSFAIAGAGAVGLSEVLRRAGGGSAYVSD